MTLSTGETETAKVNGVTSSQNGCDKMAAEPTFDGIVPENVPNITEIKLNVPAHCFRPDMKRSFYYLGKDVLMFIVLYVIMRLLELSQYHMLTYAATPIYWFLQGTVVTAIFVVGHDCGHNSFSNNLFLDDVVGTITHAFCMTPYYPWKISHRHHHKHTANMDKDEVFYPIRRSDHPEDQRLVLPGFGFGLAWWVYLVIGYSPRNVYHFNPLDKFFNGHVPACIVSVAAQSTMFYLCYQYYQYMGLFALFSHYVIPVFIFASWLVVITFLHHCEINVPWYSNESWDYVRGQVSSVDRHYGWAHQLLHNIGTHQIHHLFSKIPHYHLEEATEAFRQKYPHLVRKDDSYILPSFFRMFDIYSEQLLVEDDAKLHYFTPLSDSKKAD